MKKQKNLNRYNYKEARYIVKFKNLSELIYAIADFVKNYELEEQNSQLKEKVEDDKLYKLKEILVLYPMLTTYSINKAVNEKRLATTQLGKTRYYKRKDIEMFLESKRKDTLKYKIF